VRLTAMRTTTKVSGPLAVTRHRDKPSPPAPFWRLEKRSFASAQPRPTRSHVTTLTAGLLARGSLSRSRLPRPRMVQWLNDLRLAAYSCGGSHGIGASPAPRSLLIPGWGTVECERKFLTAGLSTGLYAERLTVMGTTARNTRHPCDLTLGLPCAAQHMIGGENGKCRTFHVPVPTARCNTAPASSPACAEVQATN
jgi:hypothetical protein